MREAVRPATRNYIATVGRRKTAVARVRLAPGTGNIIINGQLLAERFPRLLYQQSITAPLRLTNTLGAYNIQVKVAGGGLTGQAEAIRHGIARALCALDPELRPIVKKAGFLTRDPRAKERKKYGRPGARKRFQYSKR